MCVYIGFANSKKYLTKYLTTLLIHTPNIDYIANTHTKLLIHTLYLDQIFLHIWTKYSFIFGPKFFSYLDPNIFPYLDQIFLHIWTQIFLHNWTQIFLRLHRVCISNML